jgi:CRISPR-associated protein Cmr4
MKQHLLTFYTRSPLHLGCGTSVDVIDLPIQRERITGYPVIPASSLKGVFLQHARETMEDGALARQSLKPRDAQILFGDAFDEGTGESKKQISFAGCVQIMEAKLLAFPVRSLSGCFAWLTCPTSLTRFARDAGKPLEIPQPGRDWAIAGSELKRDKHVILEEYPLEADEGGVEAVADVLLPLCDDPLWKNHLRKRLAVVHDENFQHFVTTCTEVVSRIAINPKTRTVSGTALFNQENIPCEALFYTVLNVLPPRRDGFDLAAANSALASLLAPGTILQIGGDETTGHGLCLTKREELK